MRARTFTIPFSRLGDFPELEFTKDDTLTVRPLYAQDAATVAAFLDRIDAIDPKKGRETDAQQIVVDLLGSCVIEWTLRDSDGKAITIPTTPAALLALPAGLQGSFFGFFTSYRGEEPNPTTGS